MFLQCSVDQVRPQSRALLGSEISSVVCLEQDEGGEPGSHDPLPSDFNKMKSLG